MFALARSKILLAVLAAGFLQTQAFDNSRSDNLAIYWGQNSYGAATGSSSGQSSLATYCQDDTVDVIPMAFLSDFFSTGGLPTMDLSDTCSVSGNGKFSGTALPNCQFLADDIKTCQKNGKIITLSLGGADGTTKDKWAKNTAVNKDVKIYIGAPASSTAAGTGYVSASTLAKIAEETRSKYSSFGGVMLWDMSEAYANGRFDKKIKTALTSSSSSKRSVDNSTIEARSDRFTKIAARSSS
ncbi:hypothetical protein H0H93_014881 [Arthromyces matolae]|nr:hypothetical protein H0H93_014881 [Arthromyces matolae]